MAIRTKIVGRAIEILHVEDNPGDVSLLKQVLKKAGFPNRLNSVQDGEQAIAFLDHKGTYTQSPRPDVILLDLKLPRKDGLTVLTEIRQNASWQTIPVIILTSSESDLDMNWASRLNATHYVVKPMDLDHYTDLVKHLRDYWIKTFRNRPKN
jgi:two-component system, chemotaxis family, response regulator Rcp1